MNTLDTVSLESDKLHAERAQAGNIEALEFLIKKYEKPLLRYLYTLTGNREDAEDRLQETFAELPKAILNFDPNRKFSSWLYRITQYNCIDWQRGNRPTFPLEERNPPDDRPDQAHSAKMDEVYDRAVEVLPREFLHVFILTYIEGFKEKEIAKLLEIARGTVKSRLNAARNILKEIFGVENMREVRIHPADECVGSD